MTKILKLVNGLPKIVELETTISYYDESILVTTEIGVPGIGYNADHTRFTLPNGETYDGTKDQLEVFGNEAQWEAGVHFNYQNSTTATYIDTTFPIPKDFRIRFRKIS